MIYARTKPDSPAHLFLVGFLSSQPTATYQEAVDAAAAAGHTINAQTWARARKALGTLVELAPERATLPRRVVLVEPAPEPEEPPTNDSAAVEEEAPVPAPQVSRPKRRARARQPVAPLSMPLDISGHEEIDDWRAVVERIAAGSAFVLEYVDDAWNLKEQS